MEEQIHDNSARTTATTAAEGRLKVGVSSRNMRMMKKKTNALRAAVRQHRDGQGGPGLFNGLGALVRNTAGSAIRDVRNLARGVSGAVQNAIKNANPLRNVKKVQDNRAKTISEISDMLDKIRR